MPLKRPAPGTASRGKVFPTRLGVRVMENIAGEKERIRREILERRKGLSRQYCRRADQMILEKLLGSAVYKRAEAVFVYVSRAGEVDTRELIRKILADGKTAAAPRCTNKGIMKAYGIMGFEDLEKGAYGIWEPGKYCPEIRPEDIDLAVVPCLTCSHDGRRLGYGGGYYDRYLPLSPAFRAALCRERLICAGLPVETTDCLMNLVITEEGSWPGQAPENGIFTKIQQ